MRPFLTIFSFIFVALLFFTACRAEQPIQTATLQPPPATEAAAVVTEPTVAAVEPPTESATETVTVKPSATRTAAPTLEPTATNTLVPSVTPPPSPTIEPDPLIKVDDTLTLPVNVRTGPGTDYPISARFEPGQEANVVGRSEDNSWWQVSLIDATEEIGWIFGELVNFSGNDEAIPVAVAPPLPPTATSTPVVVPVNESQTEAETEGQAEQEPAEATPTSEELANQLRCGNEFCVTYQALMPIWENGGCVGNHSIYVTVLEGPPPGKPMDQVVIGDTFNNVEVGSGSHGPGRTEITLWNNSMTLVAKRHMDGTPYTSEESFNFTAADELIPAEVLAAAGYCEGRVDKCREAQQNNQVCRGHYSWRVTFHKFD